MYLQEQLSYQVNKLLYLKSFAGTFPFAILIAKPCAIAVFPTPGSPIKQGLFFKTPI